jgi:hypothetical protein
MGPWQGLRPGRLAVGKSAVRHLRERRLCPFWVATTDGQQLPFAALKCSATTGPAPIRRPFALAP